MSLRLKKIKEGQLPATSCLKRTGQCMYQVFKPSPAGTLPRIAILNCATRSCSRRKQQVKMSPSLLSPLDFLRATFLSNIISESIKVSKNNKKKNKKKKKKRQLLASINIREIVKKFQQRRLRLCVYATHRSLFQKANIICITLFSILLFI
ncbi:hypothetical protein PUN28_003818 [Cardiocondyla obscurior]|uniref:Uncharacterized protein n=1 Tax=Cardiocondyla obscurior TaxID=286306 RepID=A0AAW2GKG1_9HYME